MIDLQYFSVIGVFSFLYKLLAKKKKAMVKCEKKIDLEAKLTDYGYMANNFEMEKMRLQGVQE